jgi:threonine/homoserine/homoserine lactone efflux protein
MVAHAAVRHKACRRRKLQLTVTASRAVAGDLVVVATGFGIGLSLAAPPGPILALCAQRTVRYGFWRGMVVPLGAISGDFTLAALMGFGALPLLERAPRAAALVGLLGAALTAFLAWSAWKLARRPPDLVHQEGEKPARFPRAGWVVSGLATGWALAVSSPFNFGWWLGVGTRLFDEQGPLVFVGFFLGLFSFTVAFTAAMVYMRTRVRGLLQGVTYASAVLLAAFSVYLAYDGVRDLLHLF